jgi:hypothetical protein
MFETRTLRISQCFEDREALVFVCFHGCLSQPPWCIHTIQNGPIGAWGVTRDRSGRKDMDFARTCLSMSLLRDGKRPEERRKK